MGTGRREGRGRQMGLKRVCLGPCVLFPTSMLHDTPLTPSSLGAHLCSSDRTSPPVCSFSTLCSMSPFSPSPPLPPAIAHLCFSDPTWPPVCSCQPPPSPYEMRPIGPGSNKDWVRLERIVERAGGGRGDQGFKKGREQSYVSLRSGPVRAARAAEPAVSQKRKIA
jgi:hypothetical protein